ncbi:MAG: hypothetical protein JJ902_12935 [Roseibium sp.]|nr:hypothetical protein [Roseibium sp.]
MHSEPGTGFIGGRFCKCLVSAVIQSLRRQIGTFGNLIIYARGINGVIVCEQERFILSGKGITTDPVKRFANVLHEGGLGEDRARSHDGRANRKHTNYHQRAR